MSEQETILELARLSAALPFNSHVTLSKQAFEDMQQHAISGGAYGGPARAWDVQAAVPITV